MSRIIKNTELTKLLILTGVLTLASIALYIVGYFIYGDILSFDSVYLAAFIFVTGFTFFSLLSTLLFAFKLLKKGKTNTD
ncbi:hypothetical protein SDC9_177392 [bioreactor metagenome]|uniref:Uncharacterized protein n=1 Tax=bioreactor metagenome TaxID=1076179 RepID=A0A645GT48_9ZZZZ|nr:hypothetical protein [Erysipelotrichaceae bacterium]